MSEQTETMLKNIREGMAMDGQAPHALTREQMDEPDRKWSKENDLLAGDPEAMPKLIAAQRQALAQQAQEIERLKKGWESAYALHVDDDNRLFALEQQLAASQKELARLKELYETKKS